MKAATWLGRLKALAVIAVFCVGSGARTARGGDTSLYVKSGWFTWDERLGGASFVKEKGAMHGAGIARKDTFSRVSVAETVEVWGGNIDYDGHNLTGETRVESDTFYLGTKEEGVLGVKMPAGEGLTLEPFAGVGHRFWIRTRSGEDWNSVFVKAGVTAELGRAERVFYVRGGALLPVYTRNHVSLAGAGYRDAVTEPTSRLSSFAEAGVKQGRFCLSVEYEGWRFGQSAKVAAGKLATAPGATTQYGQVFQPESQSSLWSLKFAYSF